MGYDVPRTHDTATDPRLIAVCVGTALAAVFALFIWMDLVVSPAVTFAATTLVASVWCGWLEKRGSGGGAGDSGLATRD